MQPSRAQKKLKFAAVVLVICGMVGVFQAISYGFILAGHAGSYSSLTSDEHIQAMISYLLMALKALIFGVIPGFSFIMIGAGFSILAFLKKELRESENEIR